MTIIHLTTAINASQERCFDVARDIEVHEQSTRQTNESAVAGKTTGRAELADVITWEARHFGIKQRLTVTISKFDRPIFFEDSMLRGAFKSMRHEHHFEFVDGITIMHDRFEYEVRYGILGKLFDLFVLKRYMTGFLLKRNTVIKMIAEQKDSFV